MDAKIVIFLLGLPLALAGFVYKSPKAYDAIVSPLMTRASFFCCVLGMGLIAGASLTWYGTKGLVAPQKLSEANEFLNLVLAWSWAISGCGILMPALDIALYKLARISESINGTSKSAIDDTLSK